MVRWKESNKINKEEMKEVLDCVRLTEIPPRNLFGEVEKSCLFESDSIMKALRAHNLLNFELMRPRGIKCKTNYSTNVMQIIEGASRCSQCMHGRLGTD